MANTFQGHFSDKNTDEDGYMTTAPVASFQPMVTASTIFPATFGNGLPTGTTKITTSHLTGEVARKPRGPSDSGFDPGGESGVAKKVQRSGSFRCTDQYCRRYIVGGRGKANQTPAQTGLAFRCVKDVSAKLDQKSKSRMHKLSKLIPLLAIVGLKTIGGVRPGAQPEL